MIHTDQKGASFWLALDNLFIPSTPTNERTQVLTTDAAIMVLSELLASDDLAFSSQAEPQTEPQDKPQDTHKAESESYHQSVSSHEDQKPDSQVSTNASDEAVLAFTTQQWAAYFMLTGHSVFLETVPFGHEGLVTSKPWDLGIEYTPLEIKQVTWPVITQQPSASVEDVCCEHRLDIDVTFLQYLPGSSEVGFTIVHDTVSEALLSNAFNFTFIGCGEDAPYILYTPNAEAIALFEQYQGISNYFLDSPELFPYHIDIYASEEFSIDCDCPILTVNIFAGFGEPFQLDFANIYDFMSDNVTFLDCHQDSWFLTTGGTGFILVPYEATAPLVFDLKGDGIELTSSHHSNVLFDFDQDGTLSRTGWVGADDALLLYDYQGGQAQPEHFALTSLVEGASTDLQALTMLVNESDGILDGTNPNWDKLGLWQDTNQDGITDIGEYFTLSELGIASISLNSTSDPYVDNGNTVHGLLTFTYENGNTGTAADVSLRYEDVMLSSNTSESSNVSLITQLTSSVTQPQSTPAMDEVQQQVVAAAI